MSDLYEILKEMREEQEASCGVNQDIIETLTNELAQERKRAGLLQADLDRVDELHFDECKVLHDEIARLKLKINN